MKKYILILLMSAALTLSGCASQEQMDMMNEMKAQLNDLQFQVNSADAAASRAKDMAEEALIKASKNKPVVSQEQMNNLQFQVNSAETAAARAKDMAQEALIKASKAKSMMRKAHHGMMK